MKHTLGNLHLMLGQVEPRHIRLGLVLLTLVLFVLGAGAPGGLGGGGGG